MIRWIRRPRNAIRLVLLLGAMGLITPWAPWQAALGLPAISPLVGLSGAIALRGVTWVALLGLPLLAVAVARRRWFCRYACPVGLLCEACGRVGPSSAGWLARVPPVGQWIALATLAGACVGYPLLAWLDPLAVFAGFASLWSHAGSGYALAAAAGLPLVLLLSLAAPNLWCRRICPLGGMQELCHVRLPRPAAPIDAGQGRPLAPIPMARVARRWVLAAGLGATWAWLALRQRPAAAGVLRPPGAADEARYAGLCVRCGNCIRVCPTKILKPDTTQGLAAFLAPAVRFGPGYCTEDCCRCGQVCPSGAIARLPLDRKRTARMGRPAIELDACLLSNNRECTACVNICPYQAIAIVSPEDEYQSFPRVDLSNCPGCGACEVICPATPKAIRVNPVACGTPARTGQSP